MRQTKKRWRPLKFDPIRSHTDLIHSAAHQIVNLWEGQRHGIQVHASMKAKLARPPPPPSSSPDTRSLSTTPESTFLLGSHPDGHIWPLWNNSPLADVAVLLRASHPGVVAANFTATLKRIPTWRPAARYPTPDRHSPISHRTATTSMKSFCLEFGRQDPIWPESARSDRGQGGRIQAGETAISLWIKGLEQTVRSGENSTRPYAALPSEHGPRKSWGKRFWQLESETESYHHREVQEVKWRCD